MYIESVIVKHHCKLGFRENSGLIIIMEVENWLDEILIVGLVAPMLAECITDVELAGNVVHRDVSF